MRKILLCVLRMVNKFQAIAGSEMALHLCLFHMQMFTATCVDDV